MPRPHESLWSSANTLLETGIEIYGLMGKDKSKAAPGTGAAPNPEAREIAEGVLSISDDREVMIAVSKAAAARGLSGAARSYGMGKGGYLCYPGAMAAIPLHELSQVNAGVRGCIVSGESLRATLCGSYPEYVRNYNMAAPDGARIEDADAPPCLFLQKQLDNAAGRTRNEVSGFRTAHANGAGMERGIYEDVLELER